MSGISGVGGIMPSSGADPQDWKYITESAPVHKPEKCIKNALVILFGHLWL